MNDTATHDNLATQPATETTQTSTTYGAPVPAIRYPPYDGPWTEDETARNPYKVEGDVVFVKLTKGQVGVCDLKHWRKLKTYRWYAQQGPRTFYWRTSAADASRPSGRSNPLAHCIISGATEGMDTDHASGDGLDNRESNLRVCSRGENSRNQRLRSSNTSGFKGVAFNKWNRKHQAYITIDGLTKHIGYFSSATEAAKARDIKAIELHGNFAKLNFERETYASELDRHETIAVQQRPS